MHSFPPPVVQVGAPAWAKPGAVVAGKYQVEQILGAGGMGVVIRARHLGLDERVAIKFLLPAAIQQPGLVQRFLREGRSASKIRSEHCVRVLDVGTLDDTTPFMVMEYLEGRDLAAIVADRRPIAVTDAVDWILQAAEALAEAHAAGIVHRDVKPANLFLTRRADGTACVKVLDFGISKQTVSADDASVTRTQAVLGSPRYMSPEQMRSARDVDGRADVWALGVVLHELLAGKPPFDAETMTALCAMVVQDPPASLRAARPDTPPALEAAVLRALEKSRSARFANVAELAAALTPFGTSATQGSAERIARVLGVAASGSSAHPAAEAGLVGSSGVSVVDAGVTKPRRSTKGVLVGAGVALGALVFGVIALVGSTRRQAPVLEPPAVGAAAPGPSIAPSIAPPIHLVEPPAEPSAPSVPDVSAAPSTLDAGAIRPAPASPGRRPPSDAPAHPKARPANPFGEDRTG